VLALGTDQTPLLLIGESGVCRVAHWTLDIEYRLAIRMRHGGQSKDTFSGGLFKIEHLVTVCTKFRNLMSSPVLTVPLDRIT
jgi:hypothetical protein